MKAAIAKQLLSDPEQIFSGIDTLGAMGSPKVSKYAQIISNFGKAGMISKDGIDNVIPNKKLSKFRYGAKMSNKKMKYGGKKLKKYKSKYS